MPIYEFDCARCGHDFERLQKLSDPDPAQCPACDSQGTVRRLISAPSFRLAGTGWYETDFKSEGEGRRNLAGDAPPAAAGDAGKPDAGKSADSGSAGKADGSSKPAPAPAASSTASAPVAP